MVSEWISILHLSSINNELVNFFSSIISKNLVRLARGGRELKGDLDLPVVCLTTFDECVSQLVLDISDVLRSLIGLIFIERLFLSLS